MFLPNADSFVLTRGTIVKPSFPLFLPNTYSFLLRRRPIVRPGLPSEVAPPVRSKSSNGVNVAGVTPQSLESTDSEQPKIKDKGKRNFLKVASIAGASVIISPLSPKKASAFIMGSSPTTREIGVKNAANTRINPATQETVSTLATQATAATLLKTTDLALNTGVLDVDVVNLALPPSASTEGTLETISFGGFKFTLRLATVGNIDYVGEAVIGTAITTAAWRIKRIDSGITIESDNTGIIITWAGEDAGSAGTFDQMWSNRANLEYF